MASRGRQKSSYVPDPERRAYYRARRTVRMQVLKEHEKEIAETGFLGRLFLRLRLEIEIRRRRRNIPESHGH